MKQSRAWLPSRPPLVWAFELVVSALPAGLVLLGLFMAYYATTDVRNFDAVAAIVCRLPVTFVHAVVLLWVAHVALAQSGSLKRGAAGAVCGMVLMSLIIMVTPLGWIRAVVLLLVLLLLPMGAMVGYHRFRPDSDEAD